MRLLEVITFLGVSAALHVVVLDYTNIGSAAGRLGASGSAEITLAAAAPQMAALVEQWDAPPETATPVEALTLPETDALPVVRPPDEPALSLMVPEGLDVSRDKSPLPSIDPRLPARTVLTAPDVPERFAALDVPSVSPNVRAGRSGETAPARVLPLEQPAASAMHKAPEIDSRLPARKVLIEPDLPTRFAAAADLSSHAMPTSSRHTERAKAPVVSSLQPVPVALSGTPQIDSTSAAKPVAPQASLRPQARPRPKPVTAQAAPSKPKAAVREPAPRASSPASKASVAKGQGASNSANLAESGKPTRASKNDIARAQSKWNQQIRSAIARAQRHPGGSVRDATAKVQITVNRNGRVGSAKVVASSGHASIDRAALRAAKNARVPKAPQVLTKSSYRFNIPIRFKR